MSTASFDNIQPSAGGTARKAVRGIAAAWANLNGTGTIALRDSENVSSVVDNGTGDYSLSYTNSMSSAEYQVSLGNDKATATMAQSLVVAFINAASLAPSTSAIRLGVQSVNDTSAAAAFDPLRIMCEINGDLA